MKVSTESTKPELDLHEKGAPKNGEPQALDRRLYFQLLAFTQCHDLESVTKALQASRLEGVLYKDLNDPYGVAVVLMSENPSDFIEAAKKVYSASAFTALQPKPELTMTGRTYALGRETDLEDWLLKKPRRTALNPEWLWAIWYPLRRKAEFAVLPKEDQSRILGEHAVIGRHYGMAGFAYDIRLACHGLDKNDNEFVIGLVGADLYPLSRIVQDMRKTEQTSKYIQSLGPFFAGKAVWQSPLS